MSDHAGPFHGGEIRVQTRAGVRDGAAKAGAVAIRDHLIDQHRDFYPLLSTLFLGAADDAGQPWATVLSGDAGFVTAPDPKRLKVDAAFAPGDSVADLIVPGRDVGVLGLEFGTRRRNRLNGRAAAVDSDGFEIAVEQAFGNCPKFIQTREAMGPVPPSAPAVTHAGVGPSERAMIAAADTFFIATASGARQGVDMSHRGGKPGFVRIDADGALIWPDFPGNRFFNTLGNLDAEPRAGLLFLDWETGAGLQIAGRAETLWSPPEPERALGGERAVRFEPTAARHMPGLLRRRWRVLEQSPFFDRLERRAAARA